MYVPLLNKYLYGVRRTEYNMYAICRLHTEYYGPRRTIHGAGEAQPRVFGLPTSFVAAFAQSDQSRVAALVLCTSHSIIVL
jgi:hypothetical protein